MIKPKDSQQDMELKQEPAAAEGEPQTVPETLAEEVQDAAAALGEKAADAEHKVEDAVAGAKDEAIDTADAVVAAATNVVVLQCEDAKKQPLTVRLAARPLGFSC